MRGKKIDNVFVGEFITECICIGKASRDEILSEAKVRIDLIDKKIQEVEKLKSVRSKLVDVVVTFDKNSKQTSASEISSLNLFKIQNQNICKFICDTLKTKITDIDYFVKSEYNNQDVLFTIKQLIENKVISKNGNHLSPGAEFDNYLKIVLLEK